MSCLLTEQYKQKKTKPSQILHNQAPKTGQLGFAVYKGHASPAQGPQKKEKKKIH